MKVYAHYVEPERYPDRTPEECPVTHAALGNRVLFSGLKQLSRDPDTGRLTNVRREMRLFTDELQLCDCISPHWTALLAPNARDLIDCVKEKGLYLGNFWGFVPGFEADAAHHLLWGEFQIPEEVHRYIEHTLGNCFLGYESGENDGRYIGSYALRSAVAGRSHQEGYRTYLEFVESIGDALYNQVLQFTSLNTAHYLAKQQNATMLGAETGQALLHAPMWYSFIRGAARQYGLLTFGAVSVWNRNGYKTYESTGERKDGPCWGPTKGTSISLMRRLMYQQYFYNCDLLGIQQNWLMGDDGEKWISGEQHELTDSPLVKQLSPIGQLQQQARSFVREHGKLGVFHAPVALMLDFYAGWIPPRHMYSASVYKTWGSLPYRTGDYQAHALFEMLYPGYENAGWYSNETGFLTATPLGDMTDVLLSDADPAVMRQYPVLLLTNDIQWNYEFYRHLLQYVNDGGHLVLCASVLAQHRERLEALDGAYLHHFGVQSLGKPVALEAVPVSMDGTAYRQNGLTGYEAELLPDTQVIATAGERPVICRTPLGAGYISVILSDTGMEPCDVEPLPYNAIDHDIVQPFAFSHCVQAYLSALYRAHTPVWPTSDELQYAVAVQDATHVVLQVTNNAHYVQAFDIQSDLPIESIEPLPVEDGLFLCEGYYPEELSVNNEVINGSGDYALTAGDVCFYRVTLGQQLELQPVSLPQRQVPQLFLKLLPGQTSLRQFLLEHPTFKQKFSGIQIDADYLLRYDTAYLQQEAAFLRRQGVRLLVDLTPLLNHYPGLSFLKSYPRRYEESMATATEILRRAEMFDCAGVLLGVMRDVEIQGDVGELQRYTLEAFEQLGEITRLPLYLVNRPIMFQIDEAYGLAEEAIGMRLALDTCGALCVDAPLQQVCSEHAIRALSISAPVIDRYDQRYNAHRPVCTSPKCEMIRQGLQAVSAPDFIVLAAEYQNWDEVIQDYVYLFESDYQSE